MFERLKKAQDTVDAYIALRTGMATGQMPEVSWNEQEQMLRGLEDTVRDAEQELAEHPVASWIATLFR